MRLLEIARSQLCRGDLRGQGNDRHPRALTVEQAVDQVQVARPATAGTHRQLASEVRVRAGRECRHFLMPDVQPLDAPLPAQRISEAIQTVPDDSIDPFDASRDEGFDHLIGNGGGHVASAPSV